MNAVIIGGGEFPRKEYPLYLITSADIVVCCDGAAATYMKHFPGRLPDMLTGDLDSTGKAFLKTYKGPVLKVEDQECNDQTKAFNWLVSTYPDVDFIHFMASTGKRSDHCIANLSLLMEYASKCRARIDAVSDYSTAFPMLDSGSFSCGEGRNVSIFTPDPTLRLTSTGLKWPLDNVVFDNWWKGTLNLAVADEVHLSFSHPSKALVILD